MVQEHACRPLEPALRRGGVQLKFLGDLSMSFIDLEIEHGIRVARQSAVKCFIDHGSAVAGQADEFGLPPVPTHLNTGTPLAAPAQRTENALPPPRTARRGRIP